MTKNQVSILCFKLLFAKDSYTCVIFNKMYYKILPVLIWRLCKFVV